MIKMLNKIYNFRLWLYFTACIFLKLKKVTVTSPANSNFGSVNLSGRILSGDYDKVVPFLNIFKKNNQGNINSEITMMKAAHRFSWLYHLAAQDDKMAKISCQTLFEDWVENNSRFSLLVWDLETVGLRLIALSMNSNFILRSIRDENKFLILLIKQIMFLKLSYKLSKRGMPRLRVLLGIFFSTMILDGNKDSLGRIIIDIYCEIKFLIDEEGLYKSRNPDHLLEVFVHSNRVAERISEKNSTHAKVRKKILSLVKKMAPMLRGLRLGDGKLVRANFGSGGALGIHVDYELAKFQIVEPYQSQNLIGFERLSAGRTVLIIDCGKRVIKNLNLKTVSQESFSFEVTSGQRPIFVNNSNFNSFFGPAFSLFNTSSKYNSVSLKIKDKGYKEKVNTLDIKKELILKKKEKNLDHQSIFLKKTYIGFGGLTYTRKIKLLKSGNSVFGCEKIFYSQDYQLLNVKSFKNQKYFHVEAILSFCLHPDVEVLKIDSFSKFFLKLKNNEVWQFSLINRKAKLNPFQFVDPMNMKSIKSNQILVPINFEGNPVEINWTLSCDSILSKVTRDRKIVDQQLNMLS